MDEQSDRHLSHMDKDGKVKMVDIADKLIQKRSANASGKIFMNKDTIHLIHQNKIKKGNALATAQIAGIQAAKYTPQLIPLCHPLNLATVQVETDVQEDGIVVTSSVKCVGRTGVEMEALTATAVALLTVYDMCKAVDKNMKIGEIQLNKKAKEDI